MTQNRRARVASLPFHVFGVHEIRADVPARWWGGWIDCGDIAEIVTITAAVSVGQTPVDRISLIGYAGDQEFARDEVAGATSANLAISSNSFSGGALRYCVEVEHDADLTTNVAIDARSQAQIVGPVQYD